MKVNELVRELGEFLGSNAWVSNSQNDSDIEFQVSRNYRGKVKVETVAPGLVAIREAAAEIEEEKPEKPEKLLVRAVTSGW